MRKIFLIFFYMFFITPVMADTVFDATVVDGCTSDILGFTENVSIEPVFEPKDIQCSTGQYLPINTATCENCPAESTCTPGTYTFNENKSQGITYNETFALTKPKGCAVNILGVAGTVSLSPVFTPKNIQCMAGYYLPANSETCTTCPADAVYCPGGTYTFNETESQGTVACPTGYNYNTTAGKDDITDCQKYCNAGTYLTRMNLGGYTQLEYIEGTGTQYINTNIRTSSTGRMEYDIQLDHVMSSGETQILGSGGATSGILYSFRFEPGQNIKVYKIGMNAIDTNIPQDTNRHYLILDNMENYADIDGTRFNLSGTLSGTGSNQYLFAYSSKGTANLPYAFKGKLYGAKFYDNGVLVSDFVPARRNSDNAIGMYNKVTETFFANAGTGVFVAGPDVGGECVDVGAGYYAAASATNYGSTGTRNACPAGLTTVGYGTGADEAADCGHVLHIGEDTIYMRSAKKTPTAPALCARIGDATFYASATTADVPMNVDTTRRLRFKLGNTVYSVHDDTVTVPE